MLSHRKISANRHNAQRSTGPRSLTGKARSKRNARKHGLAMRSVSGPEQNAEVEGLAIAIMGADSDPARLHFARIAAEAELELLRVRTVRTEFINSTCLSVLYEAAPGKKIQPQSEALQNLFRLDRYERRVFSRRNRALSLLQLTKQKKCTIENSTQR